VGKYDFIFSSGLIYYFGLFSIQGGHKWKKVNH
jgi:hypothetical protein